MQWNTHEHSMAAVLPVNALAQDQYGVKKDWRATLSSQESAGAKLITDTDGMAFVCDSLRLRVRLPGKKRLDGRPDSSSRACHPAQWSSQTFAGSGTEDPVSADLWQRDDAANARSGEAEPVRNEARELPGHHRRLGAFLGRICKHPLRLLLLARRRALQPSAEAFGGLPDSRGPVEVQCEQPLHCAGLQDQRDRASPALDQLGGLARRLQALVRLPTRAGGPRVSAPQPPRVAADSGRQDVPPAGWGNCGAAGALVSRHLRRG